MRSARIAVSLKIWLPSHFPGFLNPCSRLKWPFASSGEAETSRRLEINNRALNLVTKGSFLTFEEMTASLFEWTGEQGSVLLHQRSHGHRDQKKNTMASNPVTGKRWQKHLHVPGPVLLYWCDSEFENGGPPPCHLLFWRRVLPSVYCKKAPSQTVGDPSKV